MILWHHNMAYYASGNLGLKEREGDLASMPVKYRLSMEMLFISLWCYAVTKNCDSPNPAVKRFPVCA